MNLSGGRGRKRTFWRGALLLPLLACGGGTDDVGGERGGAAALAPPFLRVLGTVQDGGLPHAGCSRERCTLAREDPAFRRRVASLAVVLPEPDGVLLVDATPDLPEQLHALADVRRPPAGRVDRSPVDGVFLTHAHMGHYLGLAHFGFEVLHTRDLPVYATARMAAFLRGNGPWSQLVELGNVELRELEPGAGLELGGGVRVESLAVPHRDEYSDTVAYRFAGPRSTLLYVPDTDGWEGWDPPLAAALDGVDVALLDGTFYSLEELPGRDVASVGHPLITRTMDLLQERLDAGSLEVHFTHMNHSNPALLPASEARRAVEARGFHLLPEGREFAL